jgi:hemerythrin HHE cation binding domain-containing protein
VNAITLVKQQHRELERVIGRLRGTAGFERTELLRHLADLFEAHAEIEEKVFYPCFKTGRSIGALDMYAEDHQEIRALVDAMQRCALEDARFPVELDALVFAFDQHVHHEEEAKLLPLVASALTDEELEALGDEMLALYSEVLRHHPGRAIHAEARRPAHL